MFASMESQITEKMQEIQKLGEENNAKNIQISEKIQEVQYLNQKIQHLRKKQTDKNKHALLNHRKLPQLAMQRNARIGN